MRSTRMPWELAITSLATLLIAASSGCTTLAVNGKAEGLPGVADAAAGESPEAATAAAPAATVVVELRADGRNPERANVLLEPGMTVQQSLEKSGAIQRFRRMNVRVMRANDTGRAKLDVKYDHAHQSVQPLYDYALHPGDYVVAEEDTTTALDDMLNSVLAPLGLNQRR
jgi:hypothetical protein